MDDMNAQFTIGGVNMRYEVQFKSSGIVAFSASERAICTYWMDCNDYGPDVAYTDPETEEEHYDKGECLNLFILVKVN